ncbi:MAG: radical SAM protein [Clostridia bacterium]|nr:radical SAM protein [Clostridia bacterium]
MLVHSFESMGARDGEGIRFIVFLSGCPLRCVYCHNPDTQERMGREYSPEEIVKKALRYKPYFKEGGGVTFSGGEPLLQSKEIVKTAELLKEKDIGYVLDTSLATPLTDSVKGAIEGADMILADLKFSNIEMMKEYTSGTLAHTLKALEFIKSINKRFILRTVVVPGINDREKVLEEYIPLVNNFTPKCWELLPFHTMGFFKYEEKGIDNPLKDTPALEIKRLNELKDYLREKTTVVIK